MGTFDDYRRVKNASSEDVVQVIHDTVSIEDVIMLYRPDIQIRHGRCPCPIHNGKDYNMSFNKDYYKCFVCGEGGDVISLVQNMFQYRTRVDAIKRICSDFDTGVYFGSPISAEASARVNKAREEHERKQREREVWEQKYHDALDEWIALDRILCISPKDPEFDFDKYVTAKKKIEFAGYKLDQILMEEPRCN